MIRTIGHSTRPIDDFVAMLNAHGVARLIDVRKVPKSRQNPQYNRDALERRLQDVGIGHEHMKALGGLRRPRKDSPNTGWRNESFRGYADDMQTVEFASAQYALIRTADQEPEVVMCAEAVPWRCHRSLIADSLTALGYPVEHIMSATKSNRHTMTSFAKLEGTSITYRTDVDESRDALEQGY